LIEKSKDVTLAIIALDSDAGNFDMAIITAINCMVRTSNINGAGASGRVFLGIAGREFRLLSKAKSGDFVRGKVRSYLMGDMLPASSLQVSVSDPEWNDPRLGWPLDTGELGRTPKYIRFEPLAGDDNWNLAHAAVFVFKGSEEFVTLYQTARDLQNLWLGKRSGMVAHLTQEFSNQAEAMTLLRTLAAS
jgi:hypothetical protein